VAVMMIVAATDAAGWDKIIRRTEAPESNLGTGAKAVLLREVRTFLSLWDFFFLEIGVFVRLL
jgi:hypothetical protein